MAEQLVGNLSTPFDPSKYVDDYHENLMKIIKAKMKGKKIEMPEPEERESTQVVDLMARLQESLDLGKRGRHQTQRHTQHHTRRTGTKSAKRSTRRKTA